MENKSKNTIIKDAIALFLITLIAGGLLGFVNQITKDPIAKAEQKAKQEAYQKVYPKAKEFIENKEITKQAEAAKDSIEGVILSEVLEAKDTNGDVIGYVMSISSKEGYGGEIALSLGFQKDGTITGLEVLSMSETAGLGANCTTEAFKKQFTNIQTDEVNYTKTGKAADNEIDALSGATITTKAVTKTVNAGIAFLNDSELVEK